MNYDAFNNLWSGIESIATIFGLLIAACWAAYTFYLKWQAALQIVIKASQVKLPNDPRPYISATVEIENKGSRNTRLPFDARDPFTVWPIEFDADGNMKTGECKSYPVTRASNPSHPPLATIVRAGTVESIPFFVPVIGPGLYFLTFVVRVSEKEGKISKAAGKPKSRPASWVGKTYLVVQ
ncbi:MAG TPA: hypothetical protein VN476_09690 [Pyrinomonadaceae bacterium]|nr:hypothetical protein [Pyrinomonadaceae bacterium]